MKKFWFLGGAIFLVAWAAVGSFEIVGRSAERAVAADQEASRPDEMELFYEKFRPALNELISKSQINIPDGWRIRLKKELYHDIELIIILDGRGKIIWCVEAYRIKPESVVSLADDAAYSVRDYLIRNLSPIKERFL